MNISPSLLLTVLLFSGCAGIDTDAPGLGKDDVQDAMERGAVLPGMTPRQVRYVWGEPRERRATAAGEQWIYSPDVSDGAGYHPIVTVVFAQGKVDSVMNGDLKQKRTQMGHFDDLTHRAPHGLDNGGTTGLRGY